MGLVQSLYPSCQARASRCPQFPFWTWTYRQITWKCSLCWPSMHFTSSQRPKTRIWMTGWSWTWMGILGRWWSDSPPRRGPKTSYTWWYFTLATTRTHWQRHRLMRLQGHWKRNFRATWQRKNSGCYYAKQNIDMGIQSLVNRKHENMIKAPPFRQSRAHRDCGPCDV